MQVKAAPAAAPSVTSTAARHHHYHGEEWHTPRGRMVREVVFGFNDGLVTGIGFVVGVTSSAVEAPLVLLTGLAAAAAASLSMAIGAYLSTKSQNEFFSREIQRERREIDELPGKERQEMEEIFSEMGFEPQEREILIRRITANKELWVRFMMREELGIFDEDFDNPVKAGAVMGAAFVLGSIPPLVPYMVHDDAVTAMQWAVAIALVAAFAAGAVKTMVAKTVWWKSGLEMMLLSALAAAIGFVVGQFIPVFVP
ncbi:MAG: VIT1/CCC1 transporter family protein [Nitrospirota bacterium]